MNIWVYEYLQAAGTWWGWVMYRDKLPSNCIFYFSAAMSLFQPSKQQHNSKTPPVWQGTQFLLTLKRKQRLSNKYGGFGMWVNPTLLTLTVYSWHLWANIWEREGGLVSGMTEMPFRADYFTSIYLFFSNSLSFCLFHSATPNPTGFELLRL